MSADPILSATVDATASFQATVTVLADFGLHARPAANLAKLAQNFKSDIRLRCGDQCVDAKSILDILSLAAQKDTELVLECHGEDAPHAGQALIDLFNTQFEAQDRH